MKYLVFYMDSTHRKALSSQEDTETRGQTPEPSLNSNTLSRYAKGTGSCDRHSAWPTNI